jgi:hypothetical protein
MTRRVPWFLWPLWLPFWLAGGVLSLTGRLVGALLGMALVAAGMLLTLTVVGAIVGVPLAFLGLLLMCRSVF